jgi:cytochrome c-type biogenesis protein CcmH/NrfG
MTQPVESVVNTAPSQTMPGATPLRMILTFEYNASTGTYQQVNVEVVATADPLTGLPARLATSEQMDDVIKLLRANLQAQVSILNQLGAPETQYDADDFLNHIDEEDH